MVFCWVCDPLQQFGSPKAASWHRQFCCDLLSVQTTQKGKSNFLVFQSFHQHENHRKPRMKKKGRCNTEWTETQPILAFTSPGVILRHLLELAPAEWHTAYARHQQSSARWKSYWHTDGQSGLILKQATQIYQFTMRLMYTC